jgi:hypothetical protein
MIVEPRFAIPWNCRVERPALSVVIFVGTDDSSSWHVAV